MKQLQGPSEYAAAGGTGGSATDDVSVMPGTGPAGYVGDLDQSRWCGVNKNNESSAYGESGVWRGRRSALDEEHKSGLK